MLANKTVTDLLAAFSAPTPTPGGGSAAALAGAIAASLLEMVASMPKTRTGSPEERAALDAVLPEVGRLRARLTVLIDEDAASYDAVVAAYRLPKTTEDEKTARTQAVARAMKGATDVPLETARTTAALAAHARVIADHGNQNARSDVTVAAALAKAALAGASINVEINLDATGDRQFATKARAELRSLAEKVATLTTISLD